MDFHPILIELILVLGGVLAFGVWQLYDLRREKARSQQKSDRDPPSADNPAD